MDLDDFRASVQEAAALLTALKKIIPTRVDQTVIDYLTNLDKDKIGLELLRNTIASQKQP